MELYKSITHRLHADSVTQGGIEKTCCWMELHNSPMQSKFRDGVTLHYSGIALDPQPPKLAAPSLYAWLLMHYAADRKAEYGEFTFFGDTRYSPQGRAVRKCLNRATESIFRAHFKMPADVYEGPAMNHSYHEMVIGHGRCFSTVLLSEKPERLKDADYTADYHRAQFLATHMALAQSGRPVVAITLKDLEEGTLKVLDEFFREVRRELKSARP